MSEESWIAASRRGDVRAFNQLVLAYQSLAYNTAYRILGDSEAAADATQDAFLSAFQAIGQYRGGSFKAWILRIVTNACYDQLRARQRRPTASLDALLLDPDEKERFVDERELPEERAARRDLNRVLQAGINTLPPDQRTALVLSDVQGLSYQEIAQVTGASLGTVKSRLSRARAALRDYLLQQEELLPTRYRLRSETADSGQRSGISRQRSGVSRQRSRLSH